MKISMLKNLFAAVGMLSVVFCSGCALQTENMGREIMRYDGSLENHNWKYLKSEAGKMVYVPFEGYYKSKGGRIQSPVVKLNKQPGKGTYYIIEFKAKASAQCYWWVDFFDAAGNLLPDNNSAVYPTSQESSYCEVFYAGEQVDSICLAFVSEKGVSVRDLVIRETSVQEAAEWCDSVYKELPEIVFTEKLPSNLPKTAAALKNGTPWRIVMLGDSIMNDTYNSMFQSLVKRDFPKSNCEFIISVRGNTGCWYYENPEYFKSYVTDLKPNLLIIGGISNPAEGNWTASIGKVICQAQKLGCEVLLLTPPHSIDWRTPLPQNPTLPQPIMTWNEKTRDFRNKELLAQEPYLKIAAETGVPVWNLTKYCADYLAKSGKPLGYFNRDLIHNNDRGKQLIGRFMQAYFRLLKQADSENSDLQTVSVVRVKHPIQIDDRMSDPAWKNVPEYKLIPFVTHESSPPKTASAVNQTKYWTDAWAKLLYDDKNLYIGFRIENDDIHAMKPKDQELLFLYGDTLEVFLKPVDSNGYFELYVNASGNKTTYFFPSRSFLGTQITQLTSLFPGVDVYAHVDGTLNNSSDTDFGWTAVMVVSRKMLEDKSGVPFDEHHPWTTLLAGYAYSKNKIHSSCFAYPKLPGLNYHRTEYYAPLLLVK